MKFILKGKEFISKKLEELELTSESMDLINQQIPGRLKEPLRVLQNTQIDLDSNQAYQSYFKNYPNHHISHYLLEKFNLAVETNSLAPEYLLPTNDKEVFIPHFNKELQRKALLLKEVVDEYDEGYHKIDEAIICMAVIHFHHKRGTEVEYRYPQNKSVEDLQNLIVHHAMPDSSHNKMEDYNFFNFQAVMNGKKKMLFGVSYFKQIKVTQEMKAANTEITRSYMQKAIAVISTLPLFGYLKLRLSSTIKVFFSDFSNYQLINDAYRELNKNVSEGWPKLQMSQLYIGSDLKVIINLFGVQEFYQIWKAVLYQKRVVIFAHSSSSASSFIVSLLTLFPGFSAFGIFSKPISKYMQALRQYSLPLRTFSSDNFMAMSFHIQDFQYLARFQKNNKGSFLLGTTNRLLKEANDYGIEMMVNLENCSIDKRKARTGWQPLSKTEKNFIAQIEEIIKTEKTLGYQGSEDMIRNRFHNFLKQQLVGIMRANQKLKEWTQKCKEYESKKQPSIGKEKKKEKNYEVMLEEGEEQAPSSRKKSDDFPPLIPSEVSNIPFPGLLTTKSFPYFLQFHNENIPDILDRKVFPSLMIQNYDYCLQISEDQFVLYSWNQNKLFFGRGRPSNFEGKEIKFYTENREELKAKSVYIGHVHGYKFNKSGFYLDRNQVYQGQYDDGVKWGYGKLTNIVHKYIGNFKNDLYDGSGQLVTGQNIYVGDFKQGMKHGNGRSQGELQYDGEWINNKPEGNGIMKIEGKQFMGIFKKGQIDQNNEYTIRYSNGSLYKGPVKNLKPEGKGYIIDENGTKMVEFKDGQIVREIEENEEGEKEKVIETSQAHLKESQNQNIVLQQQDKKEQVEAHNQELVQEKDESES